MEHENLIVSYFESNLTPQEKVLFDELMQTDPTFAKTVAFEEKVKKAIILSERQVLKKELQALELESKTRAKPQKVKWWYIAASVVVLLGISWFFVTQGSSNKQLYASFFEPYPNTVAPLVRNSSQANLKTDAFSAYEQGDYKKASHLFHELFGQTEEEYALFYNAMSLMMVDQTEAAAVILADTSWTVDYKEKSNWYLALCYLKQEKTQETKVLLRSIIETRAYNFNKAQELVKKIR